MDSGVASLIGALVGGAATYGGVWYTQRTQSKNERKREQRATEAQGLVAARILQAELAWAEARVDQALENGKYWSERYAPREEPWVEYREAIAASLDNADAWADVRDGFRAVRTIELQASKRRSDEKSRSEVSRWGRTQLEFGVARIRRAIEVLGPIAKDRARETIDRDPVRPEAEASFDGDLETAPNEVAT
jgi:hypothetical protein